jgi:REP element-mobilizing transposase RayT
MTDSSNQQPRIRGWYTRGYLPHFDVPGVPQIITFRQDDSVPARLARAYGSMIGGAKSAGERARAQERVLTHLEVYLGKGRGTRRLADPRAARIVEDAILFGDGRDYELMAWVVMPNHVHVVAKAIGSRTLALITRQWKNLTAIAINRLFGSTGRFWQPEVFDRFLRGPEHRHYAIRYVELNPVTAGLCRSPLDWPFSSARRWPERWGGRASEGLR